MEPPTVGGFTYRKRTSMVLEVVEGRGGVDHFIQGFNEIIREQSRIRGAAPPQNYILSGHVSKGPLPPHALKDIYAEILVFFCFIY